MNAKAGGRGVSPRERLLDSGTRERERGVGGRRRKERRRHRERERERERTEVSLGALTTRVQYSHPYRAESLPLLPLF